MYARWNRILGRSCLKLFDNSNYSLIFLLFPGIKEKKLPRTSSGESDQFARPGSPVYVLDQLHVLEHENKKNNLYLPYTVAGQSN